jgi:hypothetical protein
LKTRSEESIWNAGQNRPGELRVYAQSLSSEVSPSNGSQLNNALLALRKNSRVLRHRRAFADCLGANPVASALGNRARRDPGTAVQPYHEGFKQTFESGTFYLAGNRNFLFGSDTHTLIFTGTEPLNELRLSVHRAGQDVRLRESRTPTRVAPFASRCYFARFSMKSRA